MAHLDTVLDKDDVRLSKALQSAMDSRGFVSNATQFMALAPDMLAANVAYGHALRFQSHLTELQRELVICTTVRQVEYAWVHHSGLLLRLGKINPEQAELLRAGQVPDGIPAADAVMVRFILAYTAYQSLDQGLLDSALGHFTRQQVVEAAMLSSHYLGAGAMLVAFDIELEDSKELEKELRWQDKRLGSGSEADQ